jgi:hypothetical protein
MRMVMKRGSLCTQVNSFIRRGDVIIRALAIIEIVQFLVVSWTRKAAENTRRANRKAFRYLPV